MTELSGDLTIEFPRHLRAKAMEEIDRQGLDEAALATKLDVFPEGARRILSQKEWPISLGLRVLESLDMTVEVTVLDRADS